MNSPNNNREQVTRTFISAIFGLIILFFWAYIFRPDVIDYLGEGYATNRDVVVGAALVLVALALVGGLAGPLGKLAGMLLHAALAWAMLYGLYLIFFSEMTVPELLVALKNIVFGLSENIGDWFLGEEPQP